MLVIDIRNSELFGNEAGEDEDLSILNSYYIDNDEFYDFFDLNKRLSVVSARKGMGKSALLSRLEYRLKNDPIYGSPIVIRVTGNELLGLGDFSSKDQAYLENYWKRIICKKVIIEIGSNIGFALSSDEISMVEIAELDGLKSKNFIGGILSRVKGKIPVLQAELTGNIPERLEALLTNYQLEHEKSKVWILVDDIDSKYVDTADYQARVGSFFSAIRSLAFNTKNLNIRSTVRSDVWLNLRHLEDLDKWEQYIIEILWTNRHMRDMLANKILSFVKRNHPQTDEARLDYSRDYNRLFKLVFDTPIEWKGNTDTSIWEPIAAFSNKRPRWMGQLCRMAAIQSKRANTRNRKVQFCHIDQILEEFGKNRKNDLIKEHLHQFSELDALIDCFRAREKEYNYNGIIDVIETHYVRGRSSDSIPKVDGLSYKSADDLGAFVYKLGLISNKHDDQKTFTHYCDNPDLFGTLENRSNQLTWAIHLSYRKFLNIR